MVRAGIAAISLNYRVAPEHPFPADVQDVVAAYEGPGRHRPPRADRRRRPDARHRRARLTLHLPAGDEAYGGNPGLREWLEAEQIPYALAVACNAMISEGGREENRRDRP